MATTLIQDRDENGDMHDQDGNLRNAASQRLDDQRDISLKVNVEIPDARVVEEEKLQEGDFDVEISMIFGNSHWCRPTPRDEYRSMEWDEHRSTLDVQHRSPESVASCEMVRIMTHEKFTARHPHPPKPLHVNINRRNVARLNALRNPSQPSETPTDNISEQSEDAPEPMQVDQATVGRTLTKRKEKVPRHLKRGANEKEMESFRKRILRIPMDKPFEEAYFIYRLWMFFRETKETEEDIRRMFHHFLVDSIPKYYNSTSYLREYKSLRIGMRMETCMTKKVICAMQQVRG
ncbi:hypothetical protein DY000_02021549 [Brassica cretica]|uniref:Uncharacterized protein n=1 Tax=Brassica cretica TaxID=69181 RepID=A0ABQ7E1F0_BRACR|nr:hypothetical protein DY000_02021549 [Brassica cretica]